MAIPLLPIATVVRILGPKVVIRLKAIHKNLVKAKKTKKSEQEYLSFHANKQKTNQGYTDVKMGDKIVYKGKFYKKGKSYDPLEKKAVPKSIDKAAKQVEAGRKQAKVEKDLSKLSTQELRAKNEQLLRRIVREEKKKKQK